MLQGTTVPTDPCATAYANLFSGDDECSRSVQEVFTNDNDSISNILNFYNGDCPNRFSNFATACRDQPDIEPVSDLINLSKHLCCV